MQLRRRSFLAGSTVAALATASSTSEAAQTSALDSRYLFNPSAYIAAGTVFTRSVSSMPLAANSSALAAAMASMPSQFAGKSGFGWLKTSLNDESYNIPLYVVDTRLPGYATRSFTVDHYECAGDPIVDNPRIPCPSYAQPAYGGDMAMAIYDIGTGILREYFHCEATSTGWAAATAGWTQLHQPLTAGTLAQNNPAMQVMRGGSSVVHMHNELSQIGFAEIAAGVINHAVSFTFANAKSGFSWPAQAGDGTLTTTAPVQGQWFRLPPSLDLGTLGLQPLTLLVARAVQRYGGYGADRNMWCHAANLESPFSVRGTTTASLLNPSLDNWRASYDLGSALNDFPWALTQWAPVDWMSMAQAPAAGLPWRYSSAWKRTTTGKFQNYGTTTLAAFDMRCDGTAAAGAGATLTYTCPKFVDSGHRTYTIAARTTVRDTPVTASVLRNGVVVSTISSRALKSLSFTTVPGANTIAIRFTLTGTPAGRKNDILALSGITPV